MTRATSLLCVLACMAATATACDRPAPRPASSPPPPTAIVENAVEKVDDWRALTVDHAGERTQLVREDGAWKLTSPVSAEADSRAVTSLLRALGAPLALRAADPTPEQVRAWGLDAPRFRVEARGAGDRVLSIRGGDEDAFDGSIALQKEGAHAVYAMPGGAAQALALTSYALREKSVMPWRPEEVARVEVTLSKSHFTLNRVNDRDWQLEASGPAERAAVYRALSADRALRFLRFSPSDASGTSKPGVRVVWVSKRGERIELALGASEGAEVQAVRTHGKLRVIGTLPSTALETWREGPKALRKEPDAGVEP